MDNPTTQADASMAARTPDVVGRMEELSGSNSTSWTSWYGRLQFYFQANDVTDPVKQRAHLLTLCGAHTYDIVCALLQPRTPDQVSYSDIVSALQAHFDPRPSEVYSRTMFQRRSQLAEESINDYVAALRKLATHCNFGTLPSAIATTMPPATGTANVGATTTLQTGTAARVANPTLLPLEVMLRDRLVCGLRDKHLQQRLFAKKDLTFSKAYDLAVRAESAAQQQQKLKSDHSEVNKATTSARLRSSHKTQVGQGQRCWRCDKAHSPNSCKFATATCHYCRKRGHIEKACISKRKATKKGPQLNNYFGTSREPQPPEQQMSTLHGLHSVTSESTTSNSQ